MKILVTGGCGYKGSVLVPLLLADGHDVVCVDTQWFGNYLPEHPNLTNLQLDIRETDSIPLEGVEAIIHLANIANDPAVELNPTLSWEVNVLAGQQLADRAVRAGVKQFIFASSGSVYGVKDEPNVTEDLTLVPISVYNKTKMVAERVLLSYSDQMVVQIVRPATVCGISPRMRLDVAVNLLTMQALSKGEITVLGGDQTRPNIHIDDITDLYLFFIDNPHVTGVFNAGFENLSIKTIAEMATKKANAKITILPSNDPRSYRVSSDKLLAAGFRPKKTVENAIDEICAAFRSGALKDDDQFHNLKWMQKINKKAKKND